MFYLQMIIEDEEDYCLRDDQKVESGNLSKLREVSLETIAL